LDAGFSSYWAGEVLCVDFNHCSHLLMAISACVFATLYA
jgi:hypothetical protein